MIYHVCPELQAKYAREIGDYQNRANYQELMILELKRRIEIARYFRRYMVKCCMDCIFYDIGCGCAMSKVREDAKLACLRLEDEKIFYVNKSDKTSEKELYLADMMGYGSKLCKHTFKPKVQ